MPNPWDSDPIVGTVNAPSAADQLGRPVIVQGPKPVAPNLPQAYTTDPNPQPARPVPGLPKEFTTPDVYRPMSADDFKAHPNLNPSLPYLINEKTGDVKLPDQGKSTDTATGSADEAFHQDTILRQIQNIRELAKRPMSLGNVAGHGYFQEIPLIGQNAADMAGKLGQVRGDLIQQGIARLRDLNAGQSASSVARNKAEQQALADAAAALQQTQSTEEFVKGLDDAEQLYKRQLLRGMKVNPDDPAVQKKYGIRPFLIQGGKPTSENDASPPPIGAPPDRTVLTDTSAGTPEVSTETKTVTDPWMEENGPKLGALITGGTPDAQIYGWLKKNGRDPSSLPNLTDVLAQRRDPKSDVALWIKQHPDTAYPFIATYDQPIAGIEKLRAEAAASPLGAALIGAADTGSLGLDREAAGLAGVVNGEGYGKARREFVDKANLSAYEHPVATVTGNVLGGLTSLAARAPTSVIGAAKQGGGLGALYGAIASDDPSLGGRAENAVATGLTGAIAAPVADVALAPVRIGARKIGEVASRLGGASPEDIASTRAASLLPSRMPQQDTAAMRASLAEQTAQGVEPSAYNTLSRSGQDYLARQVTQSPQARTVADQALESATAKLPNQLAGDFQNAIDTAAGDEDISTFLKRPAREITRDMQDLAGREYEAGIAPIKHEPVPISPELAQTLSHEQIKGAISDALLGHSLDDTTRGILRSLPGTLKQVGDMDPKLAEKVFKGLSLDVDSVRNIATALDRKAGKLAGDSEGAVTLRGLSEQLRSEVKDLYPEFRATNDRYASRMRAIGALDDARNSFLSDTDQLAKDAGRLSAERGAPEYPEGTQPLPSQREMAMKGAQEAVKESAGKNASSSATSTGANLSAANQTERNQILFRDQAGSLQAKAAAKVQAVQDLARLTSGGTGEEAASRGMAAARAATSLHHGWFSTAASAALKGVRGINPEDTARIVDLYTQPEKAEDVIVMLEKQYGQRKARFIIDRLASVTAAANSRRTLPDEAVK